MEVHITYFKKSDYWNYSFNCFLVLWEWPFMKNTSQWQHLTLLTLSKFLGEIFTILNFDSSSWLISSVSSSRIVISEQTLIWSFPNTPWFVLKVSLAVFSKILDKLNFDSVSWLILYFLLLALLRPSKFFCLYFLNTPWFVD